MSQSPQEKYLGSTFTHFLLATLFVLCSLSGLMSRVKGRVVGRVLALYQTGHGHAQFLSLCWPGLGSWAALPAVSRSQRAHSSGAQASGQRPSHAARRPRNSRSPPPCSLCCSCWPPEGANKRQPVVCPVTIYQLSAPQGSAAPTHAQKVQHAKVYED